MIKKLIEFIDEHKTAFGATSGIKKILEDNGYELLDKKKIEKGKKYYITRNDSSIIAFNVGKKLNDPSLHITASHTEINDICLLADGIPERFPDSQKRGPAFRIGHLDHHQFHIFRR